MAFDPLPIIVLVPGAFHPTSCYDTFLPHLQRAGYSTIAVPLPSLNPTNPKTTTVTSDSRWIRDTYLIPLVEKEGKDVLLLMHSYGGVAGGAAALGLGKSTRASCGKPGGVLGLVHLSANIVAEGQSLLEGVGGEWPPFIKIDTPSLGLAIIDPAGPTLYGDVDPSLASTLEASLQPHSVTALTTPAPSPAWADSAFAGRRAFLRCTEDACLPKILQDSWIESSNKEWDIRDVKAGHSAFISQAKEVAALVVDFAKQWST